MNIAMLKQIFVLRKRTVIFLALLFAAALALQLFVSLYQEPRVEKLQAEWIKLRELEGRGATARDRDTLYRNGLADLQKFREKIYPKSHFARFIGELYEMAGKNGAELTSITYKPSLDKENQLLHYTLNISVSGKYTQLKRFIYDLGAGRGNILVIDSIAISASGETAELVQLQLSLSSWFKMEAQ